MFNNSRISDLRSDVGKRIDDMRDSVNRHMDAKLDHIIEMLASHHERITKLEGNR